MPREQWVRAMEGLLDRPELSIFHTNDPADAEALLNRHRFDVMLLLFEEEPSDAFVNMLSKTRNLSSRRDQVFAAFLAKPSRAGIQKALALGAKELIISPIDPRTLARAVDELTDGIVRSSTIANAFHEMPPLNCEIETFGRIGKIYLDPPGDLQVETDVKLHVGHTVKVCSRMAQDLASPAFEYNVAGSGQANIYYNYSNTYHLRWLASSERRQQLSKWIDKSRKVFTIPKTKVLWITQKQLGDLEACFNKDIFSMYVERPYHLSLSYLQRISPRIVIAGDLDAPVRRVLEEWLAGEREARILVGTSSTVSNGWLPLPESDPETFKAAFINLITPRLKERVGKAMSSAVFPSRKSDYSLCAIPVEARVTAVSRSCLRIEAPFEFEKDVILSIRCPPLEDMRGFGMYGKVLESVKIPRSGFVSMNCEIVPIADIRNPTIMELADSLDKKEALTLARGTQVAQAARSASRTAELFFLKAKPVAMNLGTIILAMVGVGLLFLLAYHYIPRPDYHSTQPTRSIEDIFKAFREAFQ